MSRQVGYGWVWEPEHKHLCSPPVNNLKDHFEGALWRCAECDQYWEVFFDVERGRKSMQLVAPDVAEVRMGFDVAACVD